MTLRNAFEAIENLLNTGKIIKVKRILEAEKKQYLNREVLKKIPEIIERDLNNFIAQETFKFAENIESKKTLFPHFLENDYYEKEVYIISGLLFEKFKKTFAQLREFILKDQYFTPDLKVNKIENDQLCPISIKMLNQNLNYIKNDPPEFIEGLESLIVFINHYPTRTPYFEKYPEGISIRFKIEFTGNEFLYTCLNPIDVNL